MRWLCLALMLGANSATSESPPPSGEGARRAGEGERPSPAVTVLQSVEARLSNRPMTVHLVDLPHRPGHRGVFIYLADGTPRFLGSGFDSVTIDSLSADPGLILHAHDANGALTLRCDFHGFPLECQ